MVQIKKEMANRSIWEYKVGNNANTVNFVRLWKPRIPRYQSVMFLQGKHQTGLSDLPAGINSTKVERGS